MDDVSVKQIDVTRLVEVQNHLAAALIRTAASSGLTAKGDWVQGGWSRSSAQILDKLDFGLRKEALAE